MRRPAPNEAGYAMAVLLVGMSIAAIMMTMAMPVWKQMAQREKEEELIFRGQQYVHALRMFSMKYANASPPTIDVLVEQRFLRKKYKDPITNDDFQPILVGQPIPGSSATIPGPSGARGASGSAPASPFQTGRGVATPGQAAGATGPGRGPTATTGGGATFGASGGIMGVVSKSKDKSIRLYQGRSHYNEWAFINTPQNLTPGQPGPGGAGVGGRGNQPGGPGGGVGGRGGRGGPGQPPFGPGRGGPGGPGGIGPGGFPVGPGGFPIQPNQPVQPIQPGRGRGA